MRSATNGGSREHMANACVVMMSLHPFAMQADFLGSNSALRQVPIMAMIDVLRAVMAQ